ADGPDEARAGVGERPRGARHPRAGRIGDQPQNGAGHGLRRKPGRNKARHDDETQYGSLHLCPPCAAETAPYDSTGRSMYPRSMEMAFAAATTAAATLLPASSFGMRWRGPATLMAATTSPV